jgi:hypothetical protein
MRKLWIATAFSMLGVGLAFSSAPRNARAMSLIDCKAVMRELNSGNTAAQVAVTLKISRASVHRCRRSAAQNTTTKEKNASEPAGQSACYRELAALEEVARERAAGVPLTKATSRLMNELGRIHGVPAAADPIGVHIHSTRQPKQRGQYTNRI